MTKIGSFHGENGGAPANTRGRVVVATALMVLGLSAGAGALLAHEKAEKSEQTVIKSRVRSESSRSRRGSARSCPVTSR